MKYSMLYSRPIPPFCVNLARDARAQTQVLSVSSSSRAPSQAPEGRDLDWEDYNYEGESAAGGGRQAENLLAVIAWTLDFNTEESETLLRGKYLHITYYM